MDAAEITRLLDEAHPDGVTWETHVAFVERMAEWDVERLLDFQESLFAHVVAGTWVSTFDVPEVRVGEWMSYPVTRLRDEIALRRAVIDASARTPPEHRDIEFYERQLRELAELEAIDAPAIRRVVPDEGVLGVPVITRATVSIAKEFVSQGRKPARRRVVAWANDEGYGDRSVHHILRAGAWAHRIKTGALPEGFLPVRDEELHATGELRRILVRHVLERGEERIETLWVWGAPNIEYLRARLPSIRPLTRVLDATVAGKPTFLDLRADPGRRDRGEGELIAEWLSVPEPPNSLLRDAREVLAGERRRRTTAAMADAEFWTLIELLHGDARRADAVVSALTERPTVEILAFAEALADKLHELDRPELMADGDDAGQIPMSADVFLYFRGSVVAGGRAAFEKVLRAGVLREEEWDDGGAGELMLDIAREAFERKTGREWEHETHVSVESGSNRIAWGARDSAKAGGWSGWVAVRSRAMTTQGDVDTVRHWMMEDPADARAAHLDTERRRQERAEVRIIDDLKLSSRVSPGILTAPVLWVRPIPAQ